MSDESVADELEYRLGRGEPWAMDWDTGEPGPDRLLLERVVEAIRKQDDTMAAMAEEQTEIVGELKARVRELEAVERQHVAQHLDMLANEQIPGTEDHDALTRAAELLREATPAPEAIAHIARLERWKAEAMMLLNVWDLVHDALGSPAELGESKAKASLRAAEQMRWELDAVGHANGEMSEELAAWRNKEPLSPDPERVQLVSLVHRVAELEADLKETRAKLDAEYQRGWQNGLAYEEGREL